MGKYMKYYTAVVVQHTYEYVTSRKDIRRNIERATQRIDWAVKGFGIGPKWAPTKLVVFPEFFLQGWTFSGEEAQIEIERNVAIRIPGEETEPLSKKAIEHGIYLVGTAIEQDPTWPDRVLNCGFIIGPDGKVILKYRKLTPALHWESSVSPHDMYDDYVKHSQYGTDLKTFFPVVDTPIGRLGMIICMDGFYPENCRALAVNGAEVIMRTAGNVEPMGSPPIDNWEIGNRSHAMDNLLYVVAATQAKILNSGQPENRCPGRSMIVDFNGAVMCKADYSGETITGAVINLDALRRRRMDPTWNFLAQLRTEVYREIYRGTIYPPNRFVQKGSLSSLDQRDAAVDNLIKRGIYIKPEED